MKVSLGPLRVFIGDWWWMLVDDGKVVEMYVPRETNLLFKVSPSYEELPPLDTSLDSPPTFLRGRSSVWRGWVIKAVCDRVKVRSNSDLRAIEYGR